VRRREDGRPIEIGFRSRAWTPEGQISRTIFPPNHPFGGRSRLSGLARRALFGAPTSRTPHHQWLPRMRLQPRTSRTGHCAAFTRPSGFRRYRVSIALQSRTQIRLPQVHQYGISRAHRFGHFVRLDCAPPFTIHILVLGAYAVRSHSLRL
jgi:hypothetical protein